MHTVFLLLFAILMHASLARAQTIEQELGLDASPPERAAIADRYYSECMDAHSGHTQGDREILCGCVSGTLYKNMDDRSMNLLYDASPEGDAVRTDVFNRYYIPCMGPTIQNMTARECYENESLTVHQKQSKICSCIGNNMGNFASEIGIYIIGEKQPHPDKRIGKNTADKIGALIGSYDFEHKYKSIATLCIEKYTIWRENFQ